MNPRHGLNSTKQTRKKLKFKAAISSVENEAFIGKQLMVTKQRLPVFPTLSSLKCEDL